MRAVLAGLGGAAMAMGVGAAPARSSSPPSTVVRYVAGDFYVAGPELAADVVWRETGVATAPLGSVRFRAVDERATVRIDDLGPEASVPVWALGTWRCLPNHSTLVLDGLTAGQLVDVSISDASFGLGWCGGATAGTATVTP
jgi:hypothetical protein